eukprot:1171911-Amphidinium_carterae.1
MAAHLCCIASSSAKGREAKELPPSDVRPSCASSPTTPKHEWAPKNLGSNPPGANPNWGTKKHGKERNFQLK